MWVIIVLIVVVVAAAAAIAWLSMLIEAAETPLCPRCARRTQRVRTKANGPKAADPWEPLATYRCVACNGDSSPPARALRWSKSRLKPPR
jgi:flagellar basal body-associated protein FliL